MLLEGAIFSRRDNEFSQGSLSVLCECGHEDNVISVIFIINQFEL